MISPPSPQPGCTHAHLQAGLLHRYPLSIDLDGPFISIVSAVWDFVELGFLEEPGYQLLVLLLLAVFAKFVLFSS